MPISEQGANFNRYMLVPRTLIILTRQDTILLLKGSDDKRLWSGLYNGVGGHVEQGEDVLTAAHRELFEETGLSSSNLWLCGVVTVDTQTNPGVGIFVFTGECPEGNPVFSKEGALEWIKTSELYHLPLVGDLTSLLPKILDMNLGDTPFSAHSRYNEQGNMVITFS